MKYKSKAKQLYVEVMRLRFQRSPSKLKNTPQKYPILETIEVYYFRKQNSFYLIYFY